jgi:hypothetical protein
MGERPLPPLAHLRTVLRIGMSSDEFFLACDDLMEQFALRISSPTLDQRLVGIHVAEGDVALCFLPDGKLTYVEYRGDVFMGE